MGLDDEAKLQRIGDCRELYLRYEGQHHETIEQEMRAMGHTNFHRRSLYDRFERGSHRMGWINRYGFDSLVREYKQKAKENWPQTNADNADRSKEHLSDLASYPRHLRPSAAKTLPQLPAEPYDPFPDFVDWLKSRTPGYEWEWKHQVYVYKFLRRVFDGELKRLMIFMPPRHGKSELVTKHFAAYWLKHNPSKNIILGCYGQKLANKFSKGIKRISMQDAFLERGGEEEKGSGGDKEAETGTDLQTKCEFPHKNHNDPSSSSSGSGSSSPLPLLSSSSGFSPSNSVAEWETREGGGVRAVGVGAGVTGYGADLVIIDDPIKSRAQAESATYRERVWDWFNDDLSTRLEPDAAMILIQTRWHEDDLAGRLLKQMNEDGGEQWEVINLPALSEPPASAGGQKVEQESTNWPPAHAGGSDPLDRKPGEALWPERFGVDVLNRKRKQLGSYSFGALYQQRPVPAEGGLFKRHWFRIVPYLPPGLRKKRGWDLGISKSATADYTATAGVAIDDDENIYIYDVIRRQIEYPDQRKLILGRIAAEPHVENGIELSANGHAVFQDLIRDPRIRGRALRGIRPRGDKVTRALPWNALAEAGKVFLIRGGWNHEFIDEACSFPSGTHDDQIDAVSIAVAMHRRQSGTLHRF